LLLHKGEMHEGDEVQMTTDPLRSGAPGGAWNVNKVKHKNGEPIVVTH
jgi:hypothetical protein